MDPKSTKNQAHIDGIVCNVDNCKFHSEKCSCTAKEIHVGPHHASCQSDTVCATFQPGR